MHNGNPIIIEKYNDIVKTAYSVNKEHLCLLLKQYQIPVYTNTDVLYAQNNQLICLQAGKKLQIPYDAISVCIGMKSNESIPEDERVVTIGDAEKVDNVMNAVWTAYRKCRII